jgi:hypothetical protein
MDNSKFTIQMPKYSPALPLNSICVWWLDMRAPSFYFS